jgi:hexosaminidase
MIKKNSFWFCLLILLSISINLCYSKKPVVIPSLKYWQDKSGSYVLKKTSRIVIDPQFQSELGSISKTLQEDLDSLRKTPYQIIFSSTPQKGDIYLTLNCDENINDRDAYIFDVSDYITIKSKYNCGVFYGTRTLLQLLKQSGTIQNGTAKDWSTYKERGLMVDNGRKYFTVDWLKKHIKELAYLKMNIFHFHFSDNEGFRIECETYPEITSKEHYSKDEIRELIKIAEKYYVTIIPEIDMPSHISQILKPFFPKYAIKDNQGNPHWYLDFVNEEARQFAKSIIEEYITLFPGPYWHGGCDEFSSNFDSFPDLKTYAQKIYGPDALSKDAFIDFINWTDNIVKIHGKKLRIWNDALDMYENPESKYTIKLNPDIIIEHWRGEKKPETFIAEGHQLMNCNSEYLYYVIGIPWKPVDQNLFSQWKPDVFFSTRKVIADSNAILGGKLHIWSDFPKAENEVQVAKNIKSNLRFVSQWNWNPIDTSFDFNMFNQRIDVIGLAPGVIFPKNSLPDNLAYKKRVVASSVEPNTNHYPENIVDCDPITRWSSAFLDPQWIYIDFEKSISFTRVNLLWEQSYATEYKIQTAEDALNWTTIYDTTNSDGYVDDITNLNANGRYLRIFCDKRAGPWGNSLYEVEVYDSTAIRNDIIPISDYDSITCYPNPANTTLFIQGHTDSISEYEIVNLYGQVVQSGLVRNRRINIAQLPVGLYFIQIGNYSQIFLVVR